MYDIHDKITINILSCQPEWYWGEHEDTNDRALILRVHCNSNKLNLKEYFDNCDKNEVQKYFDEFEKSFKDFPNDKTLSNGWRLRKVKDKITNPVTFEQYDIAYVWFKQI